MQEKIFNEQQLRVIEAAGGCHLVLAPPGCGKTAVLAERIVHAHEQGVPFQDMACLTFTNRAERSMRERILERMGELAAEDRLDELFVGNVHRFCLHFLFDNGIVPEHAAVIDTDTSISIIADFLGEEELHALNDNKSRQRYSRIINLQHLMYQCCHDHPGSQMVHREDLPYSCLNELCTAFGIPYTKAGTIQLYRNAGEYRSNPPRLSQESKELLNALYAASQYAQYKQAYDLLDFEDLLLLTYDAVAAQPPARLIRWLQVDEVQDLNPLQLAIIKHFCAPDATVVYLGDTQQAIFSFMGAKTNTLAMLRSQCGDGHFHNFYQNYRSPQYLLDIFNRYAEYQLGIEPALLPTTQNHEPCQPGDIMLTDAPTNIDEANMVANMVRRLYKQHPQETIAVVVAFNSDADEVSSALKELPHFKISGTDFFATLPMRLLTSHLGVARMEHDFIAWSNIFHGLHVYASSGGARQSVRAMMQLAITPTDLLNYEHSTYVAEFVKTYEQRDLVIFDTETTGLDVCHDDVVQIAAIRVHQGSVTDRLNIFLHTDRPIPPMLGDIVNPLVEEYRHHDHLPPEEGLQRFVDFARGCAILGHNVTYDYQIMEHNMRRHAPQLSMQQEWSSCLDTLKLARLLHPRQRSYKLRDLLVQLRLEGQNSHLADDDIMATLSLARHCYDCARSIAGRQLEFLSCHSRMIQHFRTLYAELYFHTQERLYTDTPLSSELQYTYRYLLQQNFIPPLPKLQHLVRYIDIDLTQQDDSRSPDGERPVPTLAEPLSRQDSDLCTMKEADLCGSASMSERVFVSTVHKAKGLEFDTVIVYDAVDGKYPSVYANNDQKRQEEARKFYVAISRARRRLIITYCHHAVSRWGSWYAKVLTPYLNGIRSCFT